MAARSVSEDTTKERAFMALETLTIDEITETFDFMDDWEDRYRYLIELGRELPELTNDEMSEKFKVRGCQSQVWLVPEMSDGKLVLRGNSDAHIVKGLVALMLVIFSGKSPAEILKTDALAILSSLGLKDHLSPMRANGLFSMVERITDIARAAN